jgi:GntR family transcriptional repressor for pyruvate dehydrogenase complex
MAVIEKIKAESLRSQVYVKLNEQLMNGTWKEGEKIPSEHKLCSMLGVSRVTVRAAIQQLEILGFVETKHGDGTFVKKFSSLENINAFHPVIPVHKNEDLITVLEFRKIIEKGTIGLAQEKITAGDFEALESIYQKMNDSRDDLHIFSEFDVAFHYKLADISGNSIVIKIYDLINEILSTAMDDIVHILGIEDGLKYHRNIIDTLRLGDKAKSEALMEEHIDITIRHIRQKEAAGL